jgi:glycosyltransferase involved in cell wall biosynthesis
MDRGLPQTVSYWTGIWEPSREALSKEADTLRRALSPGAWVISFSPGQRSSWHPGGSVVRLSGERWMLLRALAAALERSGSLSHVFGAMGAWYLLRAVGRRPVVFTVAEGGAALDRGLYDKVNIFAAESEPVRSSLREAGIPDDRIRVIYPGVDLDRFSPAARRQEPFTVAFASSPARASHFERRGVDLLVEAARRCPDIRILLLWRQWDDAAETEKAFARLAPPANLEVLRGDLADISQFYRGVHATILLTAPGYGKSCPNSVIEGLACGCPAVVSDTCGIADLLVRFGAGIAVTRDVDAVVAALHELRTSWAERSTSARALAERHFSLDAFLAAYRTVYDELA